MDDLVQYYKECGRKDQSVTFNNTNDNITVIRLRAENDHDPVHYEKTNLSGPAKVTWTSPHVSEDDSVILQLVQITLKSESYSGHRSLDIDEESYQNILEKFGLTNLVEYGTSATQIFNQISETSSSGAFTYSTVHIDDYFTLFHRYDSASNTARGVYWAGKKILSFLEKAVFHQRTIADHPCFLNLCAAVAFGAILDSRLCTISDEMARIERRTGFKAWDLGRYRPAHGDSYALSATASGYATSLAAFKRLNRLTASVLSSCGRPEMCIDIDNCNGAGSPHTDKVATRVQLLLQRNHTQQVLIDYLSTRLQNQLAALFNLITQTDTRITISLAKDSRMIASASKHDSSSMKALAAVTVVFLPGTFISALFSIPVFNWQADPASPIVNTQRFWIYWAVTLPLTLLTMLIWLAWTKIEDCNHQEREAKGAWVDDDDDSQTSEASGPSV